jgi:S-DNA-T family DNA segregation ATPase FtsK/SpoIIIE
VRGAGSDNEETVNTPDATAANPAEDASANTTDVPVNTDPATTPNNVIPLRPAAALQRRTVTGELITAAESAALDRRLSARTLRDIPVRVVRVIRESERTAKVTHATGTGLTQAPRTALRAGYTVAQGHVSWARRAGDALTHGHVREQIRRHQLRPVVQHGATAMDQIFSSPGGDEAA